MATLRFSQSLILMATFLASFAVGREAFGSTCRSSAHRDAWIKEHPKMDWLKAQGLPSETPVWVDHICPLEVGGIDNPPNYQYQTEWDARAKDQWERTPKGKAAFCNDMNSTPTRQVFNCK